MGVQHGRDYERIAVSKYSSYTKKNDHKVTVYISGLVINQDVPFLGCSPDGNVIDPIFHPQFGILEVKCPYNYREVTPKEAANVDCSFCLQFTDTAIPALHLRKDHGYYNQVQGQITITGAHWCDFVVYTFKGIFVEIIPFDEAFWCNMLTKLRQFYFEQFLSHAER